MFDLVRFNLSLELLQYRCAFSLAIVLGDLFTVPSQYHADVLRITGEFLRRIQLIRSELSFHEPSSLLAPPHFELCVPLY